MFSLSLFSDGPEYTSRLSTPYILPSTTLKEIHSAVPSAVLRKNAWISVGYALRDAALCWGFYNLAKFIDPFASSLGGGWAQWGVRWGLWNLYWFFQGLVGGGIFCTGHEAGHGTTSDNKWLNHTIGLIFHTFILAPYYSWRHSHHLHHKATGSMERDENYVPRTRSSLKLPPAPQSSPTDYSKLFEETPLWTLGRVIVMQVFGWNMYLTWNTMGSPMYPSGTNHWTPSSALFKKEDRAGVLFSNICLLIWISVLAHWSYENGLSAFIKYYFIPYIWTNHWIVMFTFLHHTDPTMPHFRKDTWTWLRGAATTVDRPLMGWMGRFFLHNISHDHVAHHFFSSVPFWRGPQITPHLQKALGESYNYDSSNTWRALYRSFTECQFVEDEGDIVFYLNSQGKVSRVAVGEGEKKGEGEGEYEK